MTPLTHKEIEKAATPDCEYCDEKGICGYDPGPQFCGMCDHGAEAAALWQQDRQRKQTWHVSTNTDVLVLGGTIATREEAKRASEVILAMADSLPQSITPEQQL